MNAVSWPVTLALDCSTEKLFLTLLGEGRGRAGLALALGRPHSETLMTASAELLRLAGLDWGGLRRLAVGCGPGSFSSLRIGLATMQGLAQALELPLYGFCGLDLLAAARSDFPGPIAVLTDARRRQVYWSLYQPGPEGPAGLERYKALTVADPAAVAARLSGRPEVLLLGNGAELYREELSRLLPQARFAGPAAAVLDLSLLAFLPWREDPVSVLPATGRPALCRLNVNASPLYIRPSDAELKRAQR